MTPADLLALFAVLILGGIVFVCLDDAARCESIQSAKIARRRRREFQLLCDDDYSEGVKPSLVLRWLGR